MATKIGYRLASRVEVESEIVASEADVGHVLAGQQDSAEGLLLHLSREVWLRRVRWRACKGREIRKGQRRRRGTQPSQEGKARRPTRRGRGQAGSGGDERWEKAVSMELQWSWCSGVEYGSLQQIKGMHRRMGCCGGAIGTIQSSCLLS